MGSVLVVVDVQNDFCEGGSLAVSGGNKVAKEIAFYLKHYATDYQAVYFSRDWHLPPPHTNGGHFALGDLPDYKQSWPIHCVQHKKGAEFHPDILNWIGVNASTDPTNRVAVEIISKGQGRPDYSALQGTTFDLCTIESLHDAYDVDEYHVCGLALDYCVRQTALGLVKLAPTLVFPDLTAAVNSYSAAETYSEFGLKEIGLLPINYPEPWLLHG